MIEKEVLDWFAGLTGFIVVLAIFIGFYIQLKKIKANADVDVNVKLEKAVADAKIETESAFEFRQLKETVLETNKSINVLSTLMNTKMADVETKLNSHERCLIKVVASTKSLHHRMNEHRLVDHKNLNEKEDEEYEDIRLD